MKRLAVAWRDLRLVGRILWLNLALFLALLLGAAAALRLSGSYPMASFLDLLVAGFHMAHLEGVVEPGDGLVPALLTFLVPALAILIVGEGALRVGSVYLFRDRHREEWDLLLAQSFSGHSIICGVGELGRAVAQRLMSRDPEAALVLIDLRPDLLGEVGLRGPNLCYLQADITTQAALENANCREASLIILASGNDAVNLEAGFKALQLNPKAEIWIRLYRSGLASLMDCMTKPNVHFFSPYERAAEALVTSVTGENER